MYLKVTNYVKTSALLGRGGRDRAYFSEGFQKHFKNGWGLEGILCLRNVRCITRLPHSKTLFCNQTDVKQKASL